MNSPTEKLPVRLTSLSHGGGCGCKIAPGVLSEILKGTKSMLIPPELLVGIETADDAAVYKLNDEQALIATTDFFMPIVDDPFDFGRIAATNAISDVYAMGGTPIMALALVGMPINVLPLETIGLILKGGESICAEAGIPIAGGHTIDSVEPIYGLVVLGLVHPSKVKRNADAKVGDVLVLGKPIGVGVLSAALKKDKLDADGYAQMIANTTQLNKPWNWHAARSWACKLIGPKCRCSQAYKRWPSKAWSREHQRAIGMVMGLTSPCRLVFQRLAKRC
jgi:selenide, water dikinase